MEEWLNSLIAWGTEILVRIQAISGSNLDPFWYFFSWLGYEEFYLIALPLVYWCIHKRIGAALAYMAMLSTWASDAIKYVFNIPRPADPRLRIKWPETSPSFLSGHTMSAVTNWGFVAVRARRVAMSVVAIIAMLTIPLSRMVLGVHFPQDLIGGYVVGLVFLAAFVVAEPVVARWVAARAVPVQIVVAVAAPLLLIFIHPAEPGAGYPASGAVKAMAALCGIGVGLVMERELLRFRVDGTLLRRVLRLALGLLLLGVVYVGPKMILPEDMPYRLELVAGFIRYALVGWTTAYLAPWLFVKVGLARQEDAAHPASATGPAEMRPAVRP